MENRTRAVVRNRTTTIRVGTIVHDSSTCKLPNTCGGSESSPGARPVSRDHMDQQGAHYKKNPCRDGQNKIRPARKISRPASIENAEKKGVPCVST